MHQTHHLHCRIIAQQHDQQNLQKWRMCQGKLQQERLLVQQLETEAAVMQMQDHAQGFQDNAAYSDSDSQSPTRQRAQLVAPLRELREANRGTSACWTGAAAEDRPSRRLSLPHQTVSKGHENDLKSPKKGQLRWQGGALRASERKQARPQQGLQPSQESQLSLHQGARERLSGQRPRA